MQRVRKESIIHRKSNSSHIHLNQLIQDLQLDPRLLSIDRAMRRQVRTWVTPNSCLFIHTRIHSLIHCRHRHSYRSRCHIFSPQAHGVPCLQSHSCKQDRCHLEDRRLAHDRLLYHDVSAAIIDLQSMVMYHSFIYTSSTRLNWWINHHCCSFLNPPSFYYASLFNTSPRTFLAPSVVSNLFSYYLDTNII